MSIVYIYINVCRVDVFLLYGINLLLILLLEIVMYIKLFASFTHADKMIVLKVLVIVEYTLFVYICIHSFTI